MPNAVDTICMSRPRPDTLNNREPTTPETERAAQELPVEEDDRIVFGSWDTPLVPPLTRRD